MEFRMAPFGVRGAWAPSSFSTLFSICWKEVPFLNISLKVGRSLAPRPLTSMTMEELFDPPDALRPLTLCNCDCKLLPSLEAFIGTP